MVLFILLTGVLVQIFITSQKGFPATAERAILDKSNYPRSLKQYRKQFIPHLGNATYLDYTGASVYPDVLIENFRQHFTTSSPLTAEYGSGNTGPELAKKARSDLLSFLGTDDSKYSVVFLASATQALKLVGERFPWTKKSRFFYTRFNHNSVLGIRKYASANGASFNATRSYQSLLTIARNMSAPGPFKHLLAMPLEDNFAGTKPSPEILNEISHINGSYAILADAAAYLPTNPLNLTEYPFHAVVMSFYKMFGFPNYGALVIRNDFIEALDKNYITSNSAKLIETENVEVNPKIIQQLLEEDLVIPENAFAISAGLGFLNKIGMENIQKHVSALTKRLYNGLASMDARIYGNHYFNDDSIQGAIVAFNLVRADGQFYGYASVIEDSSKDGFHLRGGCHCNPGACFNATGLREIQVKQYFDKKTTCGDKFDVIDGIPLGAVRASFGWASTEDDVDSFIEWVRNNYIL